MSFRDIFKKGFLTSYANTEVTFRYALFAMLVCLAISLVICAVYYLKSRKYFFSREFAVALVYTSNAYSIFSIIGNLLGSFIIQLLAILMIFVTLKQFTGYSKKRLLGYSTLSLLIVSTILIVLCSIVIYVLYVTTK